jgi:serine/threonine-protein kinase
MDLPGLWKKLKPQETEFPGLDAYEKLGVIREGTKSILYRVLGPDKTTNYCLKILKPGAAEVADKLRRIGMKWEGDWNLSFDHPNIVHTFFAGKQAETYYLVLEFLPGQSLLHQINFAPHLLHKRRLHLACTMADTVMHVHEKGAIHRDVNPKNFMFNATEDLKLIDFGICISAYDRVLARAGATGTPSYMAPEVVVNKHYNVQTDVYALGVTLYELFTGRKPFLTSDPTSLTMQHLSVHAPRPREINPMISPELDMAILRAIEKKPQERYATVGELGNALKVLRSKSDAEL